MSKIKSIPHFKSEEEEAEFWGSHDLTEYFDPKNRVDPDFTHLKPSTKSITIRFSASMLRDLKMLANEQDIPYQSLLKSLLGQKIRELFKIKNIAS